MQSAGYKNIVNQFEDTKTQSIASEMCELKGSVIPSRAWSQGDPKYFACKGSSERYGLHKLLLYLFMWHRLFLWGWGLGNSVGIP